MPWVRLLRFKYVNPLPNLSACQSPAVCLPDDPEGNAKLMLSILDCLPRANRVSLTYNFGYF